MPTGYGGYSRYNFRLTGRELDFDAIGGVIENWADGSSINTRRYGGLIAYSFDSTLVSAIHSVNTFDAMRSAFGATYVSNIVGSGFKFWPIAIWDMSLDDSVIHYFRPSTSVTGSTILITGIKQSLNGATGSSAQVAFIGNESVHLVLYGFVTSSP